MTAFFVRLLYAVGLAPRSDVLRQAEIIAMQARGVELLAAENRKLNADLAAVWASINEKAVELSADRVAAFQAELARFLRHDPRDVIRVIDRRHAATPFRYDLVLVEPEFFVAKVFRDTPLPAPPFETKELPLKGFRLGLEFFMAMMPGRCPEFVVKEVSAKIAAGAEKEILKAFAAASLLDPKNRTL